MKNITHIDKPTLKSKTQQRKKGHAYTQINKIEIFKFLKFHMDGYTIFLF